jgi:hypothetical protein
MPLSTPELIKTLKQLITDHSFDQKRNSALEKLLNRDPFRAFTNLLNFASDAVIPHEKKEDEDVFPAILKLKPGYESEISGFSSDHARVSKLVRQFRDSVGSGKLLESTRVGQDLLKCLNDHYVREDQLFQMLLNKDLGTT